ncbi:hypothetical protein C8Q74DRAFT_1365072 [Fomes fomentarius]|nr:hypothetical protein C8Q74DRAFT_1365072 [Fomes fomentarius]
MSSTRSTAAASQLQHDTKPHTASSSLEADIARLTRLLSGQDDANANAKTDAGADADVEELLRRIEAAEGLADGVEERLDGIIGNLDSLLNDLEERAARGTETDTKTGTGTGTGTGMQGEVKDETQIEGGTRSDAAPK